VFNLFAWIEDFRSSVADSLRPERIREAAEEIFPELRGIAHASDPDERRRFVLKLEARLSSGRGLVYPPERRERRAMRQQVGVNRLDHALEDFPQGRHNCLDWNLPRCSFVCHRVFLQDFFGCVFT
jgi:hypothetical protein